MKIVECNEEQFKRDFIPLIIELWSSKFNPDSAEHQAWLSRKIHANFVNFGVAVCAYSDADEPVGYLWYWQQPELDGAPYLQKAAHIIQMGLFEKYQRQGIGKKLLDEVCRRAKENGGEVLYTDTYAHDNMQAMTFYLKNKFVPVSYHVGVHGLDDWGQVYLYKVL